MSDVVRYFIDENFFQELDRFWCYWKSEGEVLTVVFDGSDMRECHYRLTDLLRDSTSIREVQEAELALLL